MAKLSELELVVVGIVWKKGPCTPYAIRKEFSTSSSSHWRGSAGAIYPLVRRLDDRGFLNSSAGKQGRRKRRTYTITRRGTVALRRWLLPPLPDEAAAVTYDPLRTRAYFLAVLTPTQRSAFVSDAAAGLHRQIAVIEAECERYARAGDGFSRFAARGALRVLRARIAWMAELGKRLSTV